MIVMTEEPLKESQAKKFSQALEDFRYAKACFSIACCDFIEQTINTQQFILAHKDFNIVLLEFIKTQNRNGIDTE